VCDGSSFAYELGPAQLGCIWRWLIGSIDADSPIMTHVVMFE